MKKLKKVLCCLIVGLIILTAVPYADSITGIAPRQVQAAQTVPSTPSLLSLKTKGKNTLILRWNAVPEATGYRIYRRPSGLKWQKMKDVFNKNQTTFTDNTPTFGVRYVYTVKAFIKKNGKIIWSDYNHEGISMIAGLNQLKLNQTKLELQTGQNFKLKLPDTRHTPAWKSSNTRIATVDGGKITAINPGTAKITATLCGKTFTCIVTVKSSSVYNKYSGKYTKVKNYLKKKGTKNGSDWYVSYGDGVFGYYLICDTQTDGITLSCDYLAGDSAYDGYAAMYLYIDCPHTYTGQISMHVEGENESLDTRASFDVRSSGKLTFYYKNGQKADKDTQELGNTLYQVLSSGCGQVLKKTVKLSLSQLGVTYTV